jgi:hypothetical protein
MHKNATKCNETLSKWCKNKHGASKIMDTLETYHRPLWEFSLNGKFVPCHPERPALGNKDSPKNPSLGPPKALEDSKDVCKASWRPVYPQKITKSTQGKLHQRTIEKDVGNIFRYRTQHAISIGGAISLHNLIIRGKTSTDEPPQKDSDVEQDGELPQVLCISH